MKKVSTLLFFVLLAFVSFRAQAQCTPNVSQNAFLIPDTATDFAPAFTYTPYEQILYIAVPTDTTVLSLPTTIDSIVVTGVTGLPTSITYTINPTDGVILGGTNACIRFAGTPTAAEIGTYPLVINSLVTAKVGGFLDTTLTVNMEGYTIKVHDSASYGIFYPRSDYKFSVFHNTPNPFSDLTEIAFMSPGKEKIAIDVYDLTGQKIFSKNLISMQGYNSVMFDGSKLPCGIYMYSISNGELTITHKMSLTRN